MLHKYMSIIGALLLFVVSSNISAGTAPTDFVREAVDGVLTTLRDGSMDKQQKRAKMRDQINRSFDFRAMSQSTLSTNWKKASEEQRTRFISLFSRLIQNTYIGRIEAYTNETVKYAKEEIKKNKAVVDTLIVTKSVNIPINYKMVQRGAQWKVYDVVIEEVSLVRSYRSSYRALVKKEGFDGLFAKMEAKIKSLDGA